MKKSVQLYDDGLDEYPLSDVVLGNLSMVVIIAAGTIACWLISPGFGVAYAITSMVMVYVVLRRLVCRNCHYFGKRCGTGWGLLAARWFSRGRIEDFNSSQGVRMAPLVYGLMMLVPLIALVVVMLGGPTTSAVILLAILLAMSFLSAGPGRRRACSVCKMRLFCKGSAAK